MYFLIFTVSFVATLLSAMSGVGSNLITLPVWLALGYSVPVAQASAKVNGVLWLPIAARNYVDLSKVDKTFALGLISFGLIGAALGTTFFLETKPALLKRIIGFLIVLLVILTFIDKDLGVVEKAPLTSRLFASFLAIPLGFYEAFFGAGNGIFTSVMLARTRGFDLISSFGYYYLIAFTWCLFSACLFLHSGYGDLGLMVPSSIGGILGAHFGSRIGKRKGTRFIKLLLMGLGGVLGIKLLLGY